MDFLDKDQYDVIIVGTGMCESVLAGALARSGRSVLHLDPLSFYGGPCASLPLSLFKDVLQKLSLNAESKNSLAEASDWEDVDEDPTAIERTVRILEGVEPIKDSLGRFVIGDGLSRGKPRLLKATPLCSLPRSYTDVSFEEAIKPFLPGTLDALSAQQVSDAPSIIDGVSNDAAAPAAESPAVPSAPIEEPKVEGWEDILRQGRQYNIDLCPQLHLSSGAMVCLRPRLHTPAHPCAALQPASARRDSQYLKARTAPTPAPFYSESPQRSPHRRPAIPTRPRRCRPSSAPASTATSNSSRSEAPSPSLRPAGAAGAGAAGAGAGSLRGCR
jgi:hypothetical protein